MELTNAIKKISRQVESQRMLMNSEQATILVSVLPFIRALGYDTQNLAEVRPEFSADAKTTGGEKVDYAIMRRGKPIIFIEAKAANIALNENHWKQLHHYFNAEDVRIGILTNGLVFRFYTDLKKSNIMDKQPFMSIDMLNLEEMLVNDLDVFTKSGFNADKIMASAQKRLIARSLRQEMKNPSDELVRLFARQVHSGRLRESDLKRYASLLNAAWRDLIDYEVADRIQAHDKDAAHEVVQPAGEPDAAQSRQVSEDEISRTSVAIPVFIEYRPRGSDQTHVLRGILHLSDNIGRHQDIIEYEGTIMSPSQAAGRAIRSVNPKASDPNGWTFWKFVNRSTGRDDDINLLITDDELRRRLMRQSRQTSGALTEQGTAPQDLTSGRDELDLAERNLSATSAVHSRSPMPVISDPRRSEPRLIHDNSYPARRLYEWGIKTAKGFIKNRRGSVKIYDAAGEKHFWVEDERILDGTCYLEMDIEISTSHRVENDYPPPAKRLVNVIPDYDRFDFKYEFRGRGRYVVTGIL